jgi:hypothetical protein
MQDVISATPFFHPFEAHRLKRLRSSFNALQDATYCAVDDIASLVRCRGVTAEMGVAVVESSKTKHELHARLLQASSIGQSIALLRAELGRHKHALMAA